MTVWQRTRKKAVVLELCGARCVPPYLTKENPMLEVGFYTLLTNGYLICITRYPDDSAPQRFWTVCPDGAALQFWLDCNANVDVKFLSPIRFEVYFPNAVSEYRLFPRFF